jgi:hypothetical protein
MRQHIASMIGPAGGLLRLSDQGLNENVWCSL